MRSFNSTFVNGIRDGTLNPISFGKEICRFASEKKKLYSES